MSKLTSHPIGLYPDDCERVDRLLAARPDLNRNKSALVRLALRELDERMARRQKNDAQATHDSATTADVPRQDSSTTADVPSVIVDDFRGARLNELLGGILRGGLILLTGAHATGKSTAAADLSAAVVEHWRTRHPTESTAIFWLDREQGPTVFPDLLRTFVEAKAERVWNDVRCPNTGLWPFDKVLAMLPSSAYGSARVIVVDSLEQWASTHDEKVALMLALRKHPASIKIVIAQTDKAGEVDAEVERVGDATVHTDIVEGAHTLRFTKRRWAPCDSWLARQGMSPPPEAPTPVKGQDGASEPPDGVTRLRAAMKGLAANAFDKLAKVGRGTTGKVLAGKTSIQSAGRGKLLKLVEKIEREGGVP